jgi:hypothetical protein
LLVEPKLKQMEQAAVPLPAKGAARSREDDKQFDLMQALLPRSDVPRLR